MTNKIVNDPAFSPAGENTSCHGQVVKRGSGRPNQDRAAISVTIRRKYRDLLKSEPNASQIVDLALESYYARVEITKRLSTHY